MRLTRRNQPYGLRTPEPGTISEKHRAAVDALKATFEMIADRENVSPEEREKIKQRIEEGFA